MPGRKRKDPGTTDAFWDALRGTQSSVRDAVRIWNSAVAQGSEISRWQGSTAVRDRKARFQACFDLHWLPSAKAGEPAEPLYVANLERLLQALVSTYPAWASALWEAAGAQSGLVQAILYNDEVTGGNILAPVKKKKPLCVYCTFREMHRTVSCPEPEAWFVLGCVQRTQVDRIEGGTSGIMRCVVNALHADRHEAGFTIHCGAHGDSQLRLHSKSFFVADHDAQRATYGIKGSAGLLPCGACSNVLSRQATSIPPGFCTIAEPDLATFHPRTDAAYDAAVHSLQEPLTKVALKEREKATGVRLLPGGLLFCPRARARLPFSSSCADVTHDYFANSICSSEIGLILEELEVRGVSLADLQQVCDVSSWHAQGQGRTQRPGYLRGLLHEKMHEAGTGFKGDASDCMLLLHVLHYYVDRLLIQQGFAGEKTKSYRALVEVDREIHRLRSRVDLISSALDVLPLARKQEAHHRAFVEAYGADKVRPKHHHRLHLPADILKLGFVPDCSAMEKKHQALKSGGIMDKHRAWVNVGKVWQEQTLGALCLVDDADATSWNCKLLQEVRPASSESQRLFRDQSLERSLSARSASGTLFVGDHVIWRWHGDGGGMIRDLVQSKQTTLRVRVTRTQIVSREPWGSVWDLTPRDTWHRIDEAAQWTTARWWRSDGARITSIH